MILGRKIRMHIAEGQRLKVTGTPTFFLGRVRQDGGIQLEKRILGAVSAEDLKNELEE